MSYAIYRIRNGRAISYANSQIDGKNPADALERAVEMCPRVFNPNHHVAEPGDFYFVVRKDRNTGLPEGELFHVTQPPAPPPLVINRVKH